MPFKREEISTMTKDPQALTNVQFFTLFESVYEGMQGFSNRLTPEAKAHIILSVRPGYVHTGDLEKEQKSLRDAIESYLARDSMNDAAGELEWNGTCKEQGWSNAARVQLLEAFVRENGLFEKLAAYAVKATGQEAAEVASAARPSERAC